MPFITELINSAVTQLFVVMQSFVCRNAVILPFKAVIETKREVNRNGTVTIMVEFKGVGWGVRGVPVPPPHFGQKVRFLEVKKVDMGM